MPAIAQTHGGMTWLLKHTFTYCRLARDQAIAASNLPYPIKWDISVS